LLLQVPFDVYTTPDFKTLSLTCPGLPWMKLINAKGFYTARSVMGGIIVRFRSLPERKVFDRRINHFTDMVLSVTC
jgi:hypothetical protein